MLKPLERVLVVPRSGSDPLTGHFMSYNHFGNLMVADDDDPNTVIAQTFTAKAITNDVIEQAAARIGFRVVSTDSDNAARGWALVTRFDSDRPFFNPADRSWSSVASR